MFLLKKELCTRNYPQEERKIFMVVTPHTVHLVVGFFPPRFEFVVFFVG